MKKHKHGGPRIAGPGKSIGRPQLAEPKQPIGLRVAADVCAFLKSTENASVAVETMTRNTRAFREWRAGRDQS